MNAYVTEAHRRYVRRERLAGSVFNAAIAIFSTYLIFSNVDVIPLWSKDGIAFDLVPTVFMLTLFGNLVVSLLAHKRLKEGMVRPIEDGRVGLAARTLPRNLLVRLLIVAVAMTVVMVPLSILLLHALGIDSMSYHQYLVFKACYGPAVGALSVAIVIEAALIDGDRAVR
jgi:uncharacterized membrane protein SpoIIM required for sporulation